MPASWPLSASGGAAGGASATLTGAGALTATGAAAGGATATLTAAGVLTASGTGAGSATATLTAGGALTATGAGAGGASAPLTPSGVVTATGAGAGGATATLTAAGALTAIGAGAGGSSANISGSGLTAIGAGVGNASAAVTDAAALTATGAGAGAATASLGETAALTAVGAGVGGATAFVSLPSGLVISTQTQSGITGGPPGNNTTETDVTFKDASGNGVRWGFIPAYGGMGGVPWYDIVSGVISIPESTLATSKADSNFHIYSHVGSNFLASEDPTYTLTELSSAAVDAVRASFDSGTSAQDANGFTWRARTALFPGEPFKAVLRIDMTNAASVTTASTDSYEVTALSGLTQTTQGGVVAWQLANGGYGTVGGSQTTPLPSTLVSAVEPDYLWITPAPGSSVSRGIVTVKKQSGSSFAGTTGANLNSQSNASRIKVYYQYDKSTATTAGTHTWYQLLVYRKGLTAAEAASIAADYLNPDTGWNDDEACYVIAAPASNNASFTPSFPTNVTKRWLNHYKLTSYTGTSAPVVALAGTLLTRGIDYVSAVDTSAQVAYVVLLKGIVSSGAGATELNTGTLTFYPPLQAVIATGAGAGGATATLSEAGALTAVGAGAGSGTGTLSVVATLTATGAGAGGASVTLSEKAALTAIGAGVGSASANITNSSSGGTLNATGAGVGGASASLLLAALLAATGPGAGGAAALLAIAAALSATGAGNGGASATISQGSGTQLTAAGGGVGGGTAQAPAVVLTLTALGAAAGMGSAQFVAALGLAALGNGAGAATALLLVQLPFTGAAVFVRGSPARSFFVTTIQR